MCRKTLSIKGTSRVYTEFKSSINRFPHKIKVRFFRNSPPRMFFGKGDPKIYSKFTGEHPC